MMEIESWVEGLLGKLKDTFKERLLFLGLQGSRRRGEATANSDIDIVVILDYVDIDDLSAYKNILAAMPENEKACGFIGGRRELFNWPKHELFQLVNDTRAYYGTLSELVPEISRVDVEQSVKIAASTLYHVACHTFLYGKEQDHADVLKNLYKGTFFVLQAVYYLRYGEYIDTKKELQSLLQQNEREILTLSMAADKRVFEDNAKLYYEKIISWSGDILRTEF